ncbi:MAG TPA: hypothetical protein VGP73_26180 [Thermoanaerobaculia bacterium]
MSEAGAQASTPRPILKAFLQEHDGWLYFVAQSGETGRVWEREFRQPDPFAIVTTGNRTLPLLHRRELARARRLLDEAEAALGALEEVRPSIRLVLESLHYPLLALYHYRAGELEAAGRSLERGAAALAAAIEIEPFLLPLAFRCAEFELHHARIARDQRRWGEMRRHIDRGVAMIDGRLPFCPLPGGGEVTLAAVKAFFRGLPPSEPQMEQFARQLTDDRTRHRLFDLFVLGIYAMPGFVIPQP